VIEHIEMEKCTGCETCDWVCPADMIHKDLEAFDAYTDEMMDREAGFGGHEVRTWVAAAAAMQAAGPFEMTLDYYRIIPEWITGMAVVRGAATR
jgi:2,3-dihydroxyphenylpropionate 1,2-dioxygenase